MTLRLLAILVLLFSPLTLRAQTSTPSLLFGVGAVGVGGAHDSPLGFSVSTGMLAERGGFLTTLSYAGDELQTNNRRTSFSTQILLPIDERGLLSLGPQITIGFLGSIKPGLVGSLGYAVTSQIYLVVAYSEVHEFSPGILVRM